MKHPLQKQYLDEHGVRRFVANAIVQRLLDMGPFDMNDIAMWDVDVEDREQFAQLIGYSLGGFSELSYVQDETYELAAGRDPTYRAALAARPEDQRPPPSKH